MEIKYAETHYEMFSEHFLRYARFDILTAKEIQIGVMWVVTSCSDVVGCRRFEGPCCLHLQVHFLPNLSYAKIFSSALCFPTQSLFLPSGQTEDG